MTLVVLLLLLSCLTAPTHAAFKCFESSGDDLRKAAIAYANNSAPDSDVAKMYGVSSNPNRTIALPGASRLAKRFSSICCSTQSGVGA